jgi:hypothetical protein
VKTITAILFSLLCLSNIRVAREAPKRPPAEPAASAPVRTSIDDEAAGCRALGQHDFPHVTSAKSTWTWEAVATEARSRCTTFH